jgi:hypothetical protein
MALDPSWIPPAPPQGAACPPVEADMSWTEFPIVYDKGIGTDEAAVRLQIDQVGQVRVTFEQDGVTTVVHLDADQLEDFQHLCLQGTNTFAREARKGWAA